MTKLLNYLPKGVALAREPSAGAPQRCPWVEKMSCEDYRILPVLGQKLPIGPMGRYRQIRLVGLPVGDDDHHHRVRTLVEAGYGSVERVSFVFLVDRPRVTEPVCEHGKSLADLYREKLQSSREFAKKCQA